MSFLNSEVTLSDLSDAELTELVRQNNEEAFEEIVSRYIGLVAHIASKYRAESFETGDFVQEGLLSLLSACKTYDEKRGSSFKNYAVLCIENRLKSVFRKTQNKSSIPNESIVPIDDAEHINDSSSNPEQLVLDKEFLNSVLKSLKTDLSQMEQKIFRLYLGGFTYAQISQTLSVPLKSVDNAIQRARKKLAVKNSDLL
ncbi:MAG: sigma-70 family RNA polymerase sigma factor [Acutalibacteraceae bacterium]